MVFQMSMNLVSVIASPSEENTRHACLTCIASDSLAVN